MTFCLNTREERQFTYVYNETCKARCEMEKVNLHTTRVKASAPNLSLIHICIQTSLKNENNTPKRRKRDTTK